MASKTSSKKAKGRSLQDWIVQKLYETFPSLRDGDIKPAIMGESGEDVKLSPTARDSFPFSVEAKNTERLDLWGSFKQAEANSGEHTPILFFKRNRSDVMVALKAEDFLNIIKENK